MDQFAPTARQIKWDRKWKTQTEIEQVIEKVEQQIWKIPVYNVVCLLFFS